MNGSEAAKTTALPQGRTEGMKVAERPKLALVRKVIVLGFRVASTVRRLLLCLNASTPH